MDKKRYLLTACFLSLITIPLTVNAETVQSKLQENTKLENIKQENIKREKEKQEAIKREKKKQLIQKDLFEVTQQKFQVQEEIEATTEKIKKLNKQIKISNTNIQKKESELNKIFEKMESLNKEDMRITTLLDSREKAFKDRVSSYYRTEGQMSFFNVIFSINSFGEFIDHFVAYDSIVNKDKKFIEEYIADQNIVADIKEKVETLQESTAREKEELEAIKAGQVKNKKEKELLSSMLEVKKKQLENEERVKKISLELLQGNVKEILDLIQNDSKANNINIQMMKSIIAPFAPDAQILQQKKGIPASITLSQIILESSGSYNGLSGLAFEAKNLFGIKGTGTAGSVYFETTEYINGQKIITNAQFASYKTYYDSMEDHANLLLAPRYQKHLKNVTSIVEYAHGIQDAGYATDPNYANKLIKIIFQYDLWKLDL